MKKRLAKTLFMLLPCIIMALSSGACGVEPRGFFRTLNHSGISVELRLKGMDESSAAEDIVTAMSRYDYALFSSSGSVSRFNAAEGDIFEGETNVLGEKDKYVRVSADNYLYSAVMRAKQLYRMTDGAFNIATKRLRERWRSNVAPSDALILRDIAGVQNPLLITERQRRQDRSFLPRYVQLTESACQRDLRGRGQPLYPGRRPVGSVYITVVYATDQHRHADNQSREHGSPDPSICISII